DDTKCNHEVTKTRRTHEEDKTQIFFFVFSCLRGQRSGYLPNCCSKNAMSQGGPAETPLKPSAGGVSGRLRPRVLHVFIEPVEAFGEHVQQRLTRRIAVRLVRQGHVADGGAMPFERHVKALGLDWERARVVVGFA